MKRLATFAAALALAASPVSAQQDLLEACAPSQLTIVANPSVPGGVPTEIQNQFSYLCGQVVNALSNVQPTVGIAFSGGAHTLGTASTIGRRLGFMPRISVTARANAAFVSVPDAFGGFSATVTDGGTVESMPTSGLPLAALQGDVVIGVFNGFSLGPAAGGLGAVDLLGSVSFIPAIQKVEDVTGLREDIVNIGIGARVGILQQGLVMPGISVSAMYRTMGEVAFGDLDNPAPAAFASDLSVLSLRAGVSKGILTFDFAAGAGYDIYTSDAQLNWNLTYECPATTCGTATTVDLQPDQPVAGELRTAAWNVYGNVGISLLLLNIVGEVGYQKATDVLDAAAFQEAGLPAQDPTTDALGGGRFFASLGARLTF
ncbi:MAG: hypothetical protein R3314_13105 [Longimicrobiales bacterium]|nr:hypothetical protein [Longimicrobiales bacterium]